MKIKKTFHPQVKGIEWIMAALYVVVVCTGTGLMWIREELTPVSWRDFMLFGCIYIGVCILLSVSIRNQRIELTEKELRLILLGMVRKEIKFNQIREVKIGKMNGSPVVEISFLSRKPPTHVPFLPFEKDWDSITTYMKEQNSQIKIDL